ncbi:MAG: hypothetical protein Q4A33_01410 [Candidatus Saccharibacteria bacterium]|nr:hypothetical protein [Candidatus Saccharibacteria bacterium]
MHDLECRKASTIAILAHAIPYAIDHTTTARGDRKSVFIAGNVWPLESGIVERVAIAVEITQSASAQFASTQPIIRLLATRAHHDPNTSVAGLFEFFYAIRFNAYGISDFPR